MVALDRLGEYFLVVGAGDVLVPIPGQTSDNPLEISFQGEVLDRYPPASASDQLTGFPPGIAMFCLPNGLRFARSPEMPIFYSFASTMASGEKLYGSCLKFYEAASNDTIANAKREVVKMLLDNSAHDDSGLNQTFSSSIIGSASNSVTDEDVVESHPILENEACVSNQSSEGACKPMENLISGGADAVPSTQSSTCQNDAFFDVEEVLEKESQKVSISPSEVEEKEETWYAPKCICILSGWPMFGHLRTFLTQLYRISLTPTPIPLERHLSNFLREVPVPPRGGVNVQFTIADKTICLSRAPPNDPLSESVVGFEMIELFELLPVESVVLILESLLLERKVILLSSQYSLLMLVAESFLLLMYPFQWQHVYIPLLPEALLDFLNAPMPFLIGTHCSFVHSYSDLPDSAAIVDLDNQALVIPGNPPKLPDHERAKLFSALKNIITYQSNIWGLKSPSAATHSPHRLRARSPTYSPIGMDRHDHARATLVESPRFQWTQADLAFANAPPPDHVDAAKRSRIGMDSKSVRQAFFRIYVSILKSYRDFINYPNENDPFPSTFFKTDEFITTFPNSTHRFLIGFLATQAFSKFIEDRVVPGCEGTSVIPTIHSSDSGLSYPDPSDSAVLFFDESVIEKHNRSKFMKRKPTPFLDEDMSKERSTFVAPSPDISVLPQSLFTYSVWPVPLNPALFNEPRITKSLLKADNARRRDLHHGQRGFGRTTLWERRASNTHLHTVTGQRYVYTVWFSLLTAVCNSKRRSKLLASAFTVLDRIRQIGIPIDQHCYRDLIQACGKCNCPELSLTFLDHLQRDGIVADASIYSALFTAFSTNGDLSRAYHTLGTLGRIKKTNAASPESESMKASLTSSWRKEKLSALTLFTEAECIRRFKTSFPGLQCLTTEKCPQCNSIVTDDHIRRGWKVDNNDYTTECPTCQSRFVPRFCVSSLDGSDPVYCEYLSPTVLQKEIDTLLRDPHESGSDYIVSRKFHLKSPTIFWNLVWHLTNLSLPITHLVPWMDVPSIDRAPSGPVGLHNDPTGSNSTYLAAAVQPVRQVCPASPAEPDTHCSNHSNPIV